LLPGFPDMGRHQMWHYIDTPFSPDGTSLPSSPPAPNALTQISSLRTSVTDERIPESFRAYQLSWLLHLIEDVHQPLHCIERFQQTQRNPETGAFIGDQGGNLVFIGDGKRLHGYWDELIGVEEDQATIAKLAKDLMRQGKPKAKGRLSEAEWVEEGV